MATYNKFNNFVKDLAEKKHDLNADQLNVYLSNAVPSATLDFVKADLAEIGTGNGYTADGGDRQNTGAVSTGT